MTPASLFKYIPFCAPQIAINRELQELRIRGFEDGKIWYPAANNLNDPYECYPDFVLNDDDIEQIVESLTPEEFIFIKKDNPIESKQKLINALKTPKNLTLPVGLKKPNFPTEFIHRSIFLATIAAVSAHYLSTVGVLSLTETPLDLRMWAHYGGNSTGICIEFERNKDNVLGSDSTKPVTYLKNRRKINYHERHQRREEIITSKFEAWADEKEWRHWIEHGDMLYPFPSKILRIIFGLNCHPSTKEIIKIIFGNKVKFEEITLGNDFSIYTDKGVKHALSEFMIK
jgi:hypothetical protein